MIAHALKSRILSLLFIPLFLYALFSYQLSNDTELSANQHYLFYTLTLLAISVVLLASPVSTFGELVRHNPVLVSIILILFGLHFFQPKQFGFQNSHFNFVTSCLLTAVILLMTIDRFSASLILFTIAGTVLIELGVACWRYFDELQTHYADGQSHDAWLEFRGTFYNSGPFACFFAVLSPFIYYLINVGKLRRRLLIYFFYIGLVVLITILTKSRAALIALIISQTFFFSSSKSRKLWLLLTRSRIWIPIGGIVIVLAAYALFKAKENSAYGRVLKYAVLSNHIPYRSASGIGLGRFAYFYPSWQADYFQTNLNVPKDLALTAGNSYHAFNEALELFIETGWVGLLVVSFLLYRLCRLKFSPDWKNLVIAATSTALAIFSCSLTSYTFHCPPLALLFVFSIVLIVKGSNTDQWRLKPFPNFLPRSIKQLFFLLLLVVLVPAGRVTLAVNQWSDVNNKDNGLSRLENLQKLEAVYEILHADGKYLLCYGGLLFEEGQCKKAVHFIKASQARFTSYESYNLLAQAAECSGDDDLALGAYRFQSSFIPSKFSPMLNMALMLDKKGMRKEAKGIARKILQMRVKVPSTEVTAIQDQARLLLQNP